MNTDSISAITAYRAFWTRFRDEVKSGAIQANSGIHWPHVGAKTVIVCDFPSNEDAVNRANDTLLEIELQIFDIEQNQAKKTP